MRHWDFHMLNPWLAVTFQAARLGLEAQNAMALRLMRLVGDASKEAGHRASQLTFQLLVAFAVVATALTFQLLVAFAVVATALLDPLQTAIGIGRLVGIVLIEASVHPCFASGFVRILWRHGRWEDCVPRAC
jgi:hypothetical protein